MWRSSKASLTATRLWVHGVPALGVPGAANWREDRDAGHLDGVDTVYVVVEPDRGGDTVREWLARSSIRHRAKLVRLPTKDPSALHLEGPEEFLKRWQAACDSAIPWTQAEAESGAAERADAWKLCGRLAGKTDILDELDHTSPNSGSSASAGPPSSFIWPSPPGSWIGRYRSRSRVRHPAENRSSSSRRSSYSRLTHSTRFRR